MDALHLRLVFFLVSLTPIALASPANLRGISPQGMFFIQSSSFRMSVHIHFSYALSLPCLLFVPFVFCFLWAILKRYDDDDVACRLGFEAAMATNSTLA